MSAAQRNAKIPRSVARAIVIKHEDIFFLAERDGGIPSGNQDGFGLYFHDCRYLGGYVIRIAGTEPTVLVSTAERGSIAQFELTNEKLNTPDGGSVPEQTFGISLQRVIDSVELAVHDIFTIENYDFKAHNLPLSFSFQSCFEDIFVIRGLHPKKVGTEVQPRWQQGVLILSYTGADGVNRSLEVHPDPEPSETTDSGLKYVLQLTPGGRTQIKFSFRIRETRQQKGKPHLHASDPQPVVDAVDHGSNDWLAGYAEVRSDNPLLNAVIERCLLDLFVLKGSLDGCSFFSAGLPWYGTLFGRDSIIAALQTLAYEPCIAEQTIRLLARHQGSKEDKWRDEEPGKILHELRRGELANLNEIPQTPYYGSVDSTPLFLILVGEHANWTGNLNLFNDIRSNVERALKWIDEYGTAPQLRYLAYASKSSKGLGNQGWKDSGDSVMNADGSLATPPIALVEVQGYVYRAKLLMADLYARSGDDETAARLRQEAGDLKERFNREFWDADKNFYAIALQKEARPADVISSNPGQALWTGIVDENRVGAVVHRLMAKDMFSGWGIRTLSHQEKRYNPIGYHLGTVWPHDNAIIAAGFRRYWFDHEAAQVFDGILHAARYFEHNRLPEVFAGFTREQFAIPVRYPVACHPQAWAAGSMPFLLTALLGVHADAFNNRLRVLRPILPNGVTELEFRRIKIGGQTVDLHFERTGDGRVNVDARKQGKVEVDINQQVEPRAA
ncbi:MAG TPA: glycogen debranching N-terminal domain-containing protein [Terracidiphilus sp.]|nr:glycogen debranching N-terminal domain-containing protein [Terracidiphilus sp.]